MIRSRSYQSDDDSTGSGLSGSSSLRSRTSSVSDLLEPSWRNVSYRSRSGGLSLNSSQRGRSLFQGKWANTQGEFATGSRNGFNSSFRIRYYKFTRRRMNIVLLFCTFFVAIILFQHASDPSSMYDGEIGDTYTDDKVFTTEAPHFQPEPQEKSIINPHTHSYNSFPAIKLSNGLSFPLVGTSLVNIDPRNIPIVVSTQLTEVDASSSEGGALALIAIEGSSPNANNGAVVSRAINFFNKRRNIEKQKHQQKGNSSFHRGLALRGNSNSLIDDYLDNQESLDKNNLHKQNTLEVHLVSRISHAHLGYGRTQLALRESFKVLPQQSKLSNPSLSEEMEVKVHFVLDSPRCYGEATYGNCDEENNAVDSHIKQAGPSPHSNSWKESWQVLENAYIEGNIASIGVSNFNVEELEALFQICKVKPHFYQGSIWSILFDESLMKALNYHEVAFHAFNINKGIIERGELAPVAFKFLMDTSTQLDLESGDADIEDHAHQARSVNKLILGKFLFLQANCIVINYLFLHLISLITLLQHGLFSVV